MTPTLPRCESLYSFAVPLCRSLSQPPLYFGNDFLVVLGLLSANFIFQRTEKMVVASQIRTVRWMRQDSPLKLCDGLSGMQACVCMWPRIVVVKKHFCNIFMGTDPPETLLQLLQSFHTDVRVDRLAYGLSARCIVAGVTAVDGRSDMLPCPCSDDANRFAQRLTVLLSTAMSP
jgi:hypothetical protein